MGDILRLRLRILDKDIALVKPHNEDLHFQDSQYHTKVKILFASRTGSLSCGGIQGSAGHLRKWLNTKPVQGNGSPPSLIYNLLFRMQGSDSTYLYPVGLHCGH